MGKNCFRLLALFAVLILLFMSEAVPVLSGDNVPENKFNLLLITIDTLRADRLSCYSTEHVETPAIDSLAAKSTLFTRAFAHTPTTLPSHTNILLGTTPLYHGVHDNLNFRVRDEYLTLAEHLKQEGYSTGAFVGAFPLDSIYGLSQGFDTYDDKYYLTDSGKQSKERRAEIVVDKALEYLNQTSSPWFLWIHCYDPHDPYDPPQPFKTKYSEHLYDGEVAYVDSVLNKLFHHLENKNLYKNTMIVFTGDHGESLGEHGEKTHSFFAYNSTIWVPLLIYVPGMKAQIVDQNVSHVDLFPTICDAIEISKPPFLQGRSLIPFNKKIMRSQAIYFESLLPYYNMGWAPIRGIIQDNNKFIDSPIPELYDLEKDFNETKDKSQKNDLEIYRKQLSELIQIQESQVSVESKLDINREALEKLKSLGYVGDTVGEKKKTFNKKDDVKVLLPFYYKSEEALSLLQKEGNANTSIKLLREVITENNRLPFAYSNLAVIFKSQGRLIDAIQVLKVGLDFIPESFDLFSSLLECLFEANQWNDLITVFKNKYFERFEFDPIVWNLLGRAYMQIGDFENALKSCEKAVSIDEKFPLSFNNLGLINFNIYNLSTNPQALQKSFLNYKKAVELDPNNSVAYNGLGLVYMYEKIFDKAIQSLETALQLQPDLDSAVYNLGMAHLKNGDKTQAFSYFSRFKSCPSYEHFSSIEKKNIEELILQCKEKEINN